MKKRFNILQVLSTVLKILGIITAALSVLGGIIIFATSIAGGDFFSALGFDTAGGAVAGLLIAFLMIIFGLLYALMIYGSGELITLLISMEDNTFRAAKLLEEVTSEEEAQ